MIHRWDRALTDGVDCGIKNSLKPGHKGSKGICDKIEEGHPGYLHELYWYAIRMMGIRTSFQEIADLMNKRSHTPSET